MYERLILMRELLSDKGSIYLHCDWHKCHHLRFLLDEVFGQDNFVNEVIWNYKGTTNSKKSFAKKHDSIISYSKKPERHIFNFDAVRIPYEDAGKFSIEEGTGKFFQWWEKGKKYYPPQALRNGKYVLLGKGQYDVWNDIPSKATAHGKGYLDYPTEKPDALVERIITASSNVGSIVLDCFCGSGITAAAAERLGRRWIMADLNKGAIQTTMKRLQSVGSKNNEGPRGLIHYRINNYDHAKIDALKAIIIAKYGIQTSRADPFFNGTVSDGSLAKIVDLDKPLSQSDVAAIIAEFKNNRAKDTRHVTVFCNGMELGVMEALNKHNKSPINKISARDIQAAGLIVKQPAAADVSITKKGKNVIVKINDYISPTIQARLNADQSIFRESIDGFLAQIDYVLIDTDYHDKCFCIVESDYPPKKKEYVRGEYKLPLPRAGATVAVRIVDMLGEETTITKVVK